ncbi:iron ABC transporter substrate-binding protein [Desulfonatronospira sp. MSAO_Bac3]|uniref:iron ABC transporter substrate-binding protein n=1 Tax=Desulfonatronospira sp. MSAO_Bac3 TaxID=2293857 RepID=UPI000FF65AE3|nr:iron ABC transporter substrate-binding protein [Desulfonatronospira sp. MSAO_Bac3]RQD78021.1 MAG: iron ABC transporter substrate-binding protein [Desulfonatronospira sp. MSAO_Bac3]
MLKPAPGHFFGNFLRPGFAFLAGMVMLAILAAPIGTLEAKDKISITDNTGRELNIPSQVDRVICSGSGCLRLLTYIQAHDRIVGVDSMEKRDSGINPRPYALANPQFKDYPLFGEFRGHDSPELIAGLDPQPQVIFKVNPDSGPNPDQLQDKTGIPVISLYYGNLTHARDDLDDSLLLMGRVMDEEERAWEVIEYFDDLEEDLRSRTRDIPEQDRPTCYIGGMAHRGPHGFQSTEPSYAPFEFLHARNVADELNTEDKKMDHATVSKEKIMVWDPEIIFIDTSTMQLDRGANARDQLQNDPAYRHLSAVDEGRVYGVFPYNYYTQNFETIFANAYYIGSVLYPERFQDIDPMRKAEEISVFLNEDKAFEKMNRQFDGMGFSRIDLE